MPLTTEVLGKYKNDVFIETGTNNGLGVQTALDTGFDIVYSIEFYDKLYDICVNKFKGNDKVKLLKGDSGERIKDILSEISSPATFWLDAHFSTSDLYKTPLVDTCPLLRELEAISDHNVNNHTILIDDMRYFRHGIDLWNNVNEGQIKDLLRRINPNYKFSLEDGYENDDILVAWV
jgi:hypothetical protein